MIDVADIEQVEPYFEPVNRILAAAVGRRQAVPIAELVERAGIPSRRLAERLLELCLDRFPFLLVAGPRGYFRPTSADDINAYLHGLHSRHDRLAQRERTVRRRARLEGWPQRDAAFYDPPTTQPDLFPQRPSFRPLNEALDGRPRERPGEHSPRGGEHGQD